ncbi:MAG: hypothetical protein HC796_04515, partial [Synechococcaceae cyanobacterium RL_1_2]|nr:hypothetical protein [Synechococcaceae cyanobacterium RL_1_2]
MRGSYTYRLYATCDDQAKRGNVAMFTILGPEGEGFYDETIGNYTSNSGWCQSWIA